MLWYEDKILDKVVESFRCGREVEEKAPSPQECIDLGSMKA